jgi:hypothetical protein
MDLIQWILHDGYFSQYELMTVIPSPKHQAQCGYNDGEGDRMDRMKDDCQCASEKWETQVGSSPKNCFLWLVVNNVYPLVI